MDSGAPPRHDTVESTQYNIEQDWITVNSSFYSPPSYRTVQEPELDGTTPTEQPTRPDPAHVNDSNIRKQAERFEQLAAEPQEAAQPSQKPAVTIDGDDVATRGASTCVSRYSGWATLFWVALQFGCMLTNAIFGARIRDSLVDCDRPERQRSDPPLPVCATTRLTVQLIVYWTTIVCVWLLWCPVYWTSRCGCKSRESRRHRSPCSQPRFGGFLLGMANCCLVTMFTATIMKPYYDGCQQ